MYILKVKILECVFFKFIECLIIYIEIFFYFLWLIVWVLFYNGGLCGCLNNN